MNTPHDKSDEHQEFLRRDQEAGEMMKAARAARSAEVPSEARRLAILDCAKMVNGRLAGRQEGSDLWLEIIKITNMLARHANSEYRSAPVNAVEPTCDYPNCQGEPRCESLGTPKQPYKFEPCRISCVPSHVAPIEIADACGEDPCPIHSSVAPSSNAASADEIIEACALKAGYAAQGQCRSMAQVTAAVRALKGKYTLQSATTRVSADAAWSAYNKDGSWGHEPTVKSIFMDGFNAAGGSNG